MDIVRLRDYEYGDAQIIADGAVDPVAFPELSKRQIEKRYSCPKNITRIAEYMAQPVGALIWKMVDNELFILNCAFHPGLRKKIIPVFVEDIRRRISSIWTRILMKVRENDDEDCIKLFCDCGFHILQENPIIPGYYKDSGESAWVMECNERLDCLKTPAHA